MTDTVTDIPVTADPATRRPMASYRTNLVTALLGAWLTAGLMLDAWAHNNIPELESFFTPWHAVFYTGFFATAAWIWWIVRKPLMSRRYKEIPLGYGSATVAVGIFALSAAGDMTWHLILGIEQNIDILFSPTHLGLGASMVIILLTPVRSAWADRTLSSTPSLGRLLPPVLSAALAVTVTLLFLQYANALDHSSGDVVVGMSTMEEFRTAALVTDILVTNLVLLMPLLALMRRWTLPFGTVTVIYAFAGALSAAVSGFGNLAIIAALLVSAVCLDLLVLWLRPSPRRAVQFYVFAAAAPLVIWTLYLALAYLSSPPLYSPDGTITARPEVVSGTPIVQALLTLAVSVLMVPRRE